MKVGIVLACLVALTAGAQTVPNYLNITLPKLETSYQGTLDETDGQNFKDGSYVELLQYQGEAGDIVVFTLSSEIFDTYLSLYHPDGSLLEVNDDSSYGSSNDYSTDSSILTALPESGRYILVVSGYSEFDVGDYSISVEQLESMQGTVFTGEGQVVNTLTEADIEDGRISQTFTLEVAQANQYIIDMMSPNIDTYLLLYNGDDLLTENDDGPNGPDSQIVIYLDPGTYTIVATSYGQAETGLYLLSVTEE